MHILYINVNFGGHKLGSNSFRNNHSWNWFILTAFKIHYDWLVSPRLEAIKTNVLNFTVFGIVLLLFPDHFKAAITASVDDNLIFTRAWSTCANIYVTFSFLSLFSFIPISYLGRWWELPCRNRRRNNWVARRSSWKLVPGKRKHRFSSCVVVIFFCTWFHW